MGFLVPGCCNINLSCNLPQLNLILAPLLKLISPEVRVRPQRSDSFDRLSALRALSCPSAVRAQKNVARCPRTMPDSLLLLLSGGPNSMHARRSVCLPLTLSHSQTWLRTAVALDGVVELLLRPPFAPLYRRAIRVR